MKNKNIFYTKNKATKRKFIKLTVLLYFIVSQYLFAEDFKIGREAFGCGTSVMSGNDYKVIGTISQSFIGISEDNINKCYAGFWNNIEAPINVETEKFNDVIFRIFPNPFENFTVIEFFSDKELDVELTLNNLLGQKVTTLFTGICKAGLNRVSLTSGELQVGVYYLQLKMEQYKKTLMVVKQ